MHASCIQHLIMAIPLWCCGVQVCPLGVQCRCGKQLWSHILSCRSSRCEYPRCRFSKEVLKHHRRCQVRIWPGRSTLMCIGSIHQAGAVMVYCTAFCTALCPCACPCASVCPTGQIGQRVSGWAGAGSCERARLQEGMKAPMMVCLSL